MQHNLAVPQNLKYEVTMWPQNSILKYTPKEMENICSDKNMYMKVHNGNTVIVKRRKQLTCSATEE